MLIVLNNEHKNLHIDNNQDNHTNSINYEANGYISKLVLVIISH